MSDDADSGDDLPDKLFFRIGETAELVGVEPHVLRYWETEFRMIPERSTSGQRMYRRSDISRFLEIRRLLHDEGFTIVGARKVILGDTDAATEPSPSFDAGRLQQASSRLEGVRVRVAELRQRVGRYGTGPDGSSTAVDPSEEDG